LEDRRTFPSKTCFNLLLSAAAEKGEEIPWPAGVLQAVTGSKPATGEHTAWQVLVQALGPPRDMLGGDLKRIQGFTSTAGYTMQNITFSFPLSVSRITMLGEGLFFSRFSPQTPS